VCLERNHGTSATARSPTRRKSCAYFHKERKLNISVNRHRNWYCVTLMTTTYHLV